MGTDTDHDETRRHERAHLGGAREFLPHPDAGRGDGACSEHMALLREILRGQRRIDQEVGAIKTRLEVGNVTLEGIEGMKDEARELRDSLVELKTKMAGVLWVAGIAGTVSLGAIVTAIMALILRSHP